MTVHVDPPKFPKWIFLAGDAALLATAALIASSSAHPAAGTPLIAITTCVVLGCVLGAIPFLAEYARRQDEALDERQRGLEALAATVATSAEQIGIAASGLHQISELAQRSLKQAEQLHHQLGEKFAELQSALADGREEDKEEAARLESAAERIAKACADTGRTEASLRKMSAAILAEIETRLAAAGAAAAGQASAAVGDRVATALANAAQAVARMEAAAAQIAGSGDGLEGLSGLEARIEVLGGRIGAFAAQVDEAIGRARLAPSSLPAEPVAPSPAAIPDPSPTADPSPAADPAPDASAPAPASAPPAAPAPAPAAASAPAALPPRAEAPAIAKPIEEADPVPVSIQEGASSPLSSTEASNGVAAGAEASASTSPSEVPAALPVPVSPAPAPPAPRKRAPRKAAPVAPTGESEAPDSSESEDLPLLSGFSESAQRAADLEPREEIAESALSADGATRLQVTAYIGIGNRLFIRGEGPGLTWERGVPLQFISIGKWRWETQEATAPIRFRLYKNDETSWSANGERELMPGRQHEITATF